eukprot:SAG22_NODE_164_length_16817_cov_61.573573_4_plen_82_part_00
MILCWCAVNERFCFWTAVLFSPAVRSLIRTISQHAESTRVEPYEVWNHMKSGDIMSGDIIWFPLVFSQFLELSLNNNIFRT